MRVKPISFSHVCASSGLVNFPKLSQSEGRCGTVTLLESEYFRPSNTKIVNMEISPNVTRDNIRLTAKLSVFCQSDQICPLLAGGSIPLTRSLSIWSGGAFGRRCWLACRARAALRACRLNVLAKLLALLFAVCFKLLPSVLLLGAKLGACVLDILAKFLATILDLLPLGFALDF